MSKPATRQRMLRQLLVAVLDAPAPTQIRFIEEPGRHDLTMDVASAADAHALVNALHMRDARESGQPHPIATTPTCWSGYYNGKLLGWDVLIHFDAPFAGEYITRWDAEGGFDRFPATRPAELEQVAHA